MALVEVTSCKASQQIRPHGTVWSVRGNWLLEHHIWARIHSTGGGEPGRGNSRFEQSSSSRQVAGGSGASSITSRQQRAAAHLVNDGARKLPQRQEAGAAPQPAPPPAGHPHPQASDVRHALLLHAEQGAQEREQERGRAAEQQGAAPAGAQPGGGLQGQGW